MIIVVVLVMIMLMMCAVSFVSALVVIRRKNTRQEEENDVGYTDSVSCDQSVQPQNQKQKKFLKRARHLVKQLLDHLETQTKSQKAQALLNRLTQNQVYLMKGTGSGRLTRNRATQKACMYLNPAKIENDGRLQSLICHELAHLVGKGHDDTWRQTNIYLLQLTSRELGWKNELKCGSCRKYGICEKQLCPLCTWLAGDHTTCTTD
jgi:hypothetical protein